MANSIAPIARGHLDSVTTMKKCVRRYYVTGTETYKASVEPERGRVFHYTTSGHDWPGNEYKVANFHWEAVGHPSTLKAWVLVVNGTTQSMAALPGYSQKLSYVRRWMTASAVVVKPEFLGARAATQEDVDEGRHTPADVDCKIDDWIYKDAEAGTTGDKDVTTAPYVRVSDTGDTPLRVEWIGRTVYELVHHVEFYSKRSPDIDFYGYVTAWPTDFAPLTRSTPLTNGAWRCGTQNFEEENDDDGLHAYKITRTFIRVPREFGIDCRWNPENVGPAWTSSWR